MSSFDARLRVPGQARLPLNVVVEIVEEVISFTNGDRSLGSWPIEAVGIDVQSDGFHLTFDNEEIVLTVTDPSGFVDALDINSRSGQQTGRENADTNGEPVLSAQNGVPKNGLSGRLESVTPEEKFADVIGRISELRSALTDENIPPQDVFGRWLRLLKEINLRHGQGSMPTPLFYRLNTELLDLIPAPQRAPRPEMQPVGAGTPT